jgi:hypothetical protein
MKKFFERVVEPELLDVLPPEDKSAQRSRRDLRRLNWWMNHSRRMARLLRENLKPSGVLRIAEIGAGDGHFLFSVARRMHRQWPNAEVTLVDRLNAFSPRIREEFGDLGWHARTEMAEVNQWLQQLPPDASDVIVSNLFLHQFQTGELTEMLRMAARSTRLFIALEPSRSWIPRFCGNFLWTLGCSSVTRHDAGISIRAGFSGSELSPLWPDKAKWSLIERPMGLFSHLFVARRKD